MWKVESSDIRVTSVDGQAVARFVATIPGGGASPVLDLSAQGTDLKVSATHKYIPAGKLGARTLEWFDRAFVDGRVVSGDLTYRGSVHDFPFRKDEGLFLARGHVVDAVFDYQPGWVPASDVTADVEFRNEGMHIRATAAKVGGLRMTDAIADIPDLKDTHLRIKAAARGDLQDGLEFLANSPRGAGARRALRAPERPRSRSKPLSVWICRCAISTSARSTCRRASRTRPWRCAMSMHQRRQLQGTLTVHNTLVAAADLHAQWLGGPLDVVIRPDGNTASTLSATGTATAAQLKPFLPSAIKVSGSTQWRLATEFHTDAARKSGVRIESDLRGLGIALPEPLGKSEGEQRAFQVTLEADGDSAMLARSWLGDARAIVRVARGDDGWSLDRGGIRADGNAPALPNHRGLRIEGNVEHFVLDDWLALKGDDSGDAAAAGGKKLSDYLQAANVRVGTFELAGYQWSDVRGMLQATTAGWRVDVDGPGAAGQVLIPEQFGGAQPLRAALERLVLDKPESTGTGEAETATRPTQHSEPAGARRGLAPRHSRAWHARSQGEPRAAGNPLRQRGARRRVRACGRAGRMARGARGPAFLDSRRASRARTSLRRCARWATPA